MKILDRYLTRTLLKTIACVTLLVVGVGFLIGMIGEVRAIGKGDYGVFDALYYVLLRTPGFLCEVSPLVVLIGCLTGLGLLANSGELVMMRLSGFSIFRILRSVLMLSWVIILFVLLVGEGIAPSLNFKAEVMRHEARAQHGFLKTSAGVWLRDGNNFIHISEVLPEGKLRDITEYQMDNHYKMLGQMHAKTGQYVHHRWLLEDVTHSVIDNDKVTIRKTAQAPWQVSLNPNILEIMKVDTDEMNLIQLYKYLHYLKANNLRQLQMEVIFWQRVFAPFALIVMLALSVPLIFGRMRSSTLGYRLLGGCIIGFTFYSINHLLPPLTAVVRMPAMLAGAFPILLFGCIAMWLVSRQERLRPHAA